MKKLLPLLFCWFTYTASAASLLLNGGTNSYSGTVDPGHAIGCLPSNETAFTNLPGNLSSVVLSNGTPSASITVGIGRNTSLGATIDWANQTYLNSYYSPGFNVYSNAFSSSVLQLNNSQGDLGVRINNLPAGVYDVFYIHGQGCWYNQAAKVNIGFNLTSLSDPNGLQWTMAPNNNIRWSAAPGPGQWDSSSTGNNVIRQRIRITDPVNQKLTVITENTSTNTYAKVTGLEIVSVPNPDPANVCGSGNFNLCDVTSGSLAVKINQLRSMGATMARVGLYPSEYYQNGAPSPANADAIINAFVAAGIKPLLTFEFYHGSDSNQWSYNQGWTEPLTYYNWYNIGNAFAAHFGTKIPIYAAINEPDLPLAFTPDQAGYDAVDVSDYHDALKDLADGAHAANANIKVINGGFASANSSYSWTCEGYASAIADLLNDGTLDGIDLHMYWGKWVPINLYSSTSAHAVFAAVKNASGITADTNLYVTEYNTPTVNDFTESQCAKWMLTQFWDINTVMKNDGVTLATQAAFPYSMFTGTSDAFNITGQTAPWAGNLRGATLQCALSIGSSMTYSGTQGAGTYVYTSGNKTLWVLQNVASTYGTWNAANGTQTSITCTLPSGTKKLFRYGYDGLRETISISGQTTYTFSDIPTNETTMILATP